MIRPETERLLGPMEAAGPWDGGLDLTRLAYVAPPLLGLFVVGLIHTGRWYLALAPVMFLAVLPLARIPWLPAALILVTTCTLYSGSAFPYVQAGGFGLYISEAFVLLSLFAGTLYVMRNGTTSDVLFGGLGLLMLALLVFEAIGVATGASQGVEPKIAIMSARQLTFFAAYWVTVIAATRDASRRGLLRAAIAVSVLTVVFQVVQIVLGTEDLIFQVGEYSDVVLEDPSAGGAFVRVRPPGLTLVYVTAAFAASYLVWGPPRRRLAVVLLLCVCLTGVLLSYNRNMILGLATGMLAAGLLARRRSRPLLLGASTVIVVSFVVALALSSGPGGMGGQIVDRVLSLGDVEGLESGTLVLRRQENTLALRQIEAHPLAGIGWGTSYGHRRWDSLTGTQFDVPSIHNQYYHLWLRAGLFGLCGMLGLLLGGIVLGARRLRSQEPEAETWLGAAVVASLVALALSSVVGMYMSQPPSIVTLMGVLGMASAIHLQTRSRRAEADRAR